MNCVCGCGQEANWGCWMKGHWNRGLVRSIEVRHRISKKQQGMSRGPKTDEARRNMSDARKGMKFSDAHRQALSAAKVEQMQRGAFGGKQQSYTSLKTGEGQWSHSSYETRRMKFLDGCPDVVTWTKKHKIVIPYEWKGAEHRYIPDFFVEYTDGIQSLQEVKGWIRDPSRTSAKERAARAFCEARGWEYRVLFNENLEER